MVNQVTMSGSNVPRVSSVFRIMKRLCAPSHGCTWVCTRVANNGIDSGNFRPNGRYYSSDLKIRGLRSLEKYIDVRQGEILRAEMFEDKILSSKKPRRLKDSIFALKTEYTDLPSETHLQSRNRNPRNMELLGYNKPRGYGTLHNRRDFWNKCVFHFMSKFLIVFYE